MTLPLNFPLTHVELENNVHTGEYVSACIRNNPRSLVTISVYTTGHGNSSRPKTGRRGYLRECSASNIYQAAKLLLSHYPEIECKYYRVAVMFADPAYPFKASVLWAPVRFVLDSHESEYVSAEEGGVILRTAKELCPDVTIHWNDPDRGNGRLRDDGKEMQILTRSLADWTVLRTIESPMYHYKAGKLSIN